MNEYDMIIVALWRRVVVSPIVVLPLILEKGNAYSIVPKEDERWIAGGWHIVERSNDGEWLLLEYCKYNSIAAM